MSQATLRKVKSFIGPLQIVILVLVLITAFVHLNRAIPMLSGGGGGGGPRPGGGTRPGGGGGSILSYIPIPLGTLFLLNFISYIVLGAALYMPPLHRFQRIIRWLLIALVVLTILAWFSITQARPNNIGYLDKTVEVALIILLVVDDWLAVRSDRVQRNIG